MPFRVVMAVVTAASFMTASPAQAASTTASRAGDAPAGPVIRYAGLSACVNDGGVGRHPCGPWKLWLSDGRVRALPDARRTDGDNPAMGLMAVSPDGRRAAYFRGSDGALMIWEVATGRARQTKVKRPDSVRVTGLTLSPGGRFVGVEGERPTAVEGEHESQEPFRDRVVDTVTGRTFVLPRGYGLARFSPDDRHLMATHRSGAVVYATGTWAVKLRRSVYMAGDLGPDGVTVAKASRNDAYPSRNRVTVRNLATGKKSTFPLRLRKGEFPSSARWDAAGRLDLLTDSYRGPSGKEYHTYTWYRLDRGTGRLRKLDSFVVTSAVGDVILAD
ncbi:hypothetical protein ACFOWE_20000 [Planomonospora corallina]|uniref:WD40 repeat domain-containing protein n=1 Tax=Planomonospora corallina TaxID=1806052 RepID=A0ABV8I8P4_9ACTN